MLEARLRRAETRGTEERVPVVRVLGQAIDLARAWPRSNVVLPLRARGQQ